MLPEKLYFISSLITIGETIRLIPKSILIAIIPALSGFAFQSPNISTSKIKKTFWYNIPFRYIKENVKNIYIRDIEQTKKTFLLILKSEYKYIKIAGYIEIKLIIPIFFCAKLLKAQILYRNILETNKNVSVIFKVWLIFSVNKKFSCMECKNEKPIKVKLKNKIQIGIVFFELKLFFIS